MVKIVHFVHHTKTALDDGVGTEGSRPLTQSQPQSQQGPGIHQCQHLGMTAFIATMAEDGIVEHGRVWQNRKRHGRGTGDRCRGYQLPRQAAGPGGDGKSGSAGGIEI